MEPVAQIHEENVDLQVVHWLKSQVNNSWPPVASAQLVFDIRIDHKQADGRVIIH